MVQTATAVPRASRSNGSSHARSSLGGVGQDPTWLRSTALAGELLGLALRFSWRVSDLLNVLLMSSFCLNYFIDLYCLTPSTMSNSQGFERHSQEDRLSWHLASCWLWPSCACFQAHFGIILLLTLALLISFSSCSIYYSHMCKDPLQFSSRITPKINEHFVLTSWRDMGH